MNKDPCSGVIEMVTLSVGDVVPGGCVKPLVVFDP